MSNSEHLHISTPDALLPIKEARRATGLSRATLYKLVRDGHFPPPVRVGTRVLFSSKEVQAWIAQRLARRSLIVDGGRK